MAAQLTMQWKGTTYHVDWAHPFPIGIALHHGAQNPNAWHAPPPAFAPVTMGDFVGRVSSGGAVNFFDVRLSPHGNGTHTECIGHITPEHHTLADCITKTSGPAQLISTTPTRQGSDAVITRDSLSCVTDDLSAVIVRTLPNDLEKTTRQYTGQNPPYFHPDLLAYLARKNILHFLTDLPSVDKEDDGGALSAHKAWWQYPEAPRMAATISEMIFVPDTLEDGLYWIELGVPTFALDAAPSTPRLYRLTSA